MSSNPGLLPDGTPNRAYQEALYRHNNPQLSDSTFLMSSSSGASRNLGYNRPQQYAPQAAPPPPPPPPSHPHQTAPYPHAPPQQYDYYGHNQHSAPHGGYNYNAPQTNPPPNGGAYGNPYMAPSPYGGRPPGGSAPGRPPTSNYMGYQQQQAPPYSAGPYGGQGGHTPHASNSGMKPMSGGISASRGSFRPSGRRKALLVGINYRGTSAELRGCVRDVTFVHHLLTTKFGFRNSDFVVLTDEPSGISGVRRGAPTRSTIIDSLRWLVSGARPGDSLWFSFSGHGSQVRDTSGDESDGYDETILPVDYRKSGHIVDDELYDIVRRITRGARLTVLLDACHSGLDLPYQHDVFGTGSGQKMSAPGRQQSFTQGLMGVAGALLHGNAAGALSAGLSLATGKKKKHNIEPDPNAGEVLLFSGCKDNQTSADTSKLSGGLTTGAMTYALIETLEHSTVGDWRNYTYRKLLHTMRHKLRANRMTQTPQFSTSHPFDLDQLFVL